jgi:dTDP-4-amino-4,6-dideoxygalactose transaminase
MKISFLELGATYQELRTGMDAAWRRVMDSGWYLFGPEVESFEREFAEYCEAPHCVGVANGLEALTLLLKAYGIGPGDEVVVPANTYIATWLAVTHAGATPVPVEPDPIYYNIDPGRIAAVLTPRARAILPVHLYGAPADMDPILDLARGRGLAVIEDAAQAHGARYLGRRVGNLSDATAFSFYPSKNLGAFGDAGAVVTRDAGIAGRVRVLGNYGSAKKYYNEAAGHNSRLDSLQAAMLRVKLGVLDEWNGRRRRIAARYLASFADLPELILPAVPEWAEPCWHLFVVRHPRRDNLQEHLAAHGIGTLIHYPIPPHLSGAYASAGWREGDFPVTEEIARTALSLPMNPQMTDEAVEAVIGAVRSFIEKKR